MDITSLEIDGRIMCIQKYNIVRRSTTHKVPVAVEYWLQQFYQQFGTLTIFAL